MTSLKKRQSTGNSLKYGKRGVSADKVDVHEAIRDLDNGLFPRAFCKVLPDIAAGDDGWCNIMHADTAGTKTVLAYLYWKETGDADIWKGIAQDAVVMNIDDMACAGVTDNIILSSTIGRNKNLIPGEVIKKLIDGTVEFVNLLSDFGITVKLAGGETADVGDVVRTLDVGITAFSRLKRTQVVDINIQPRDVIIGLASYGRAVYENNYNSGIGCNGLTSARHDVLGHYYKTKYPESFDAAIPPSLAYCGNKKLTDIDEQTGLTIGQLLLSPTRTYLPLIRQLLAEHFNDIHGIIHCTGGAQTKVMNFVKNIYIIKDNLFPVPPVFRIIQNESNTSWREMFQVFNMGHRIEIFVNEKDAPPIITLARKFGIDAQIIGHCEKSFENKLSIFSPCGNFSF